MCEPAYAVATVRILDEIAPFCGHLCVTFNLVRACWDALGEHGIRALCSPNA